MADIRIVLVVNDDRQSTDASWANQLAPQLQDQIDARKPAIQPHVEITSGFAKIPSVEELGQLSLVALVLPEKSRGFLQPEKDRIAAFQQSRSRGDIRLVPLSREQSRDVPPCAPLMESCPRRSMNRFNRLISNVWPRFC